MTDFTHLDESGDARMVDVAAKEVTDRRATAQAFVRTSAQVIELLRGSGVPKGDALARISGPLRPMLSAERVLLNFLQRLSGVATLTARYVKEVEGTKAGIYDTRKTTPGWREPEKYAVRCGGGFNHRYNLADAVMLKDNHFAHLGGNHAAQLERFVNMSRQIEGVKKVFVEVDHVDKQLDIVLNVQGIDVILLDNMTVEEYLKFCLSIHDIKKEEHDIKIKEVIESCSIKDRLKDDIKTLSKGLKQRVGLAGALIHNPKILILDEPTTGLDPNQILEIRELIKKISKNKTIMISTHIMQEVEAICDRVIIINKGEIVLSSDINEIKSKTESNILKAKIKTEENISDRVKNEISTINNVLEVNTNFSSGEINIEIKVDSNIDLRHDFMKYIQIHNYDLLEIIKKESTLEDIFKKLTK